METLKRCGSGKELVNVDALVMVPYPALKEGPGEPDPLPRLGSTSSGGGFETPSASTRDAFIAGSEAIAVADVPIVKGGGSDGDFDLRSGALAMPPTRAVGRRLISSSSWSTANAAGKGGCVGKFEPDMAGKKNGTRDDRKKRKI